jgi:FkbM family methyltransferase
MKKRLSTLQPIRNAISTGLISLARRVASDNGWAKLLSSMGTPSMLGGLIFLQQKGFSPRKIIDGGACCGDWTVLARSIFPSTAVLMIEPQVQHEASLVKLSASLSPNVQYSHSLLGPRVCPAADFIVLDDSSGGTGSSVLPENLDVPRHTISIPMITLDQLAVETGFGYPDLIKLDVQGYELEVLKGAPKCLAQADFVPLEVSILPYNEGCPLIAETLNWMDRAGFSLFEVFDLSRRKSDNLLVKADLLFVRKSHPLILAAPPL